MNFLYLAYNLWSFRKEIKFVVIAFLIVLSLPVIAVFILVNAGINVVSDQLVTVDTQTQEVEIHDPKDGSIITKITPQVTWPVSGVITLEFGESDFPYQILHTGIDIANPYGKIGDPIHPFMEGTVTYAGEIWWGFGKHIMIDNGNNISSLYGHLSKIYVYKGQKVKITDIIGEEGSTGWSTGPHIHFQINVFGIPVNPRTFLGQGNPS
ncbi:MAG: M23 family metallopeptidase [Candidatus Daviesbacteria bacterium]|nr:M23 family metallopeptidase [Candidatus Daviesbacteria bacterium]